MPTEPAGLTNEANTADHDFPLLGLFTFDRLRG